MTIACLPLAVLAGLGADAVVARVASLRARVVRSAAVALAGVLVVGTLAYSAVPHRFLNVSVIVVVIPGALVVAALTAGWWTKPRLWTSAIAALVLVETLVWNQRYIPFVADPMLCTASMVGRLRQPSRLWQANRRKVALWPNTHMYGLEPAINGYDPLNLARVWLLLSEQGNPVFQRVISHGDVTANHYRGHLFLKRPFWLARQYVEGELPDRDALFPAATTVFLKNPGQVPVPRVEAGSLPDSSVSGQAGVIALVRRDQSGPVFTREMMDKEEAVELGLLNLPPFHCALELVFVSDCAAAIQPLHVQSDTGHVELGRHLEFKPSSEEQRVELPLPDFEHITTQFAINEIEEGGEVRILEASLLVDEADEGNRISMLSWTANRAVVQVADLPGPRILTFTDAYYEGWQAYVDGQRTAILEADDVFKAVALLPGPHIVEFVFRPTRVYVGIGVSFMTVYGALFFLAWRGYRRVWPR